MIYIVLGMHKSGTTLVSQVLQFSGISMGDFDANIHYDKGNKYERESSLALDLEILGTETYDVLHLSGGDHLRLDDQLRNKMKTVIAEAGEGHTDWGIKDPRMCLTYHLWATELPQHKLIVVYRDPAQVWPRFKWMGNRKYLTNFNRAYAYLQRWQEHNQNIIRTLATTACEKIVLSYHELMTSDAEFSRLQDFVGHPIDDRRRPELYRSRRQQDIFIRFADWLLAQRTGVSTSDTMNELREFRIRELG